MKMIKVFIISVFVMFLIASGPGKAVFAQQQMSEEDQKMMKLWQEYATPGENHKYFEYFVGNWDIVSTMWMKPGAEPEVSKGEATGALILGGRYLKSTYTGSMMGIPFEGMSITGYDNYKKEFQTVFVDNFGTGIYQTSGILDKTVKIRTETGMWDDFMTGGKSKVKYVTKIIDNNKFLFEMFMIDPAGKEFKSGEIAYTRKK